MATKYLIDIDLAKNSLNNARIQNLAADPSSPVVGQTYFNTGSNKLRTFNGTTWDEYGTGAGSGDFSSNTSTSVDSEVVLFSGTGGKTGKRATGTGIAKLTSGVLGIATAGTDYTTPSSTETVTNKNLTSGTNTFPTLNQNTTGTASTITGNITESQVTNLTTDLGAKAPLASPALTGTPTAPTASPATNNTQIATTAYVDAATTVAANGFDVKGSVRAATTANVATLAGGAPNVVDGVTLAANDRILVKNQSTASQNGIYTVTTLGTGANGTWTRATDADANAEVTAGMYTWATEGTANGDSGWYLTTDDPIILGTTSLTFVQFTGLGQITAGNGLSKSSNTLSIDTTITVDKTTAQALTNKDLTGAGNTFPTFNQNTTGSAATLTTSRTINGVGFNGSANITVPGNKASATYGDGTTTSFPITHGLGIQWVNVNVYEVSTGNMVWPDIQVTSSTVVTITHNTAPTTNQYRYVIG